VKIYGMSPQLWCKDRFNIFDATVIVFSWLDIVLSLSLGTDGASITALRTFRTLRFFRLARSFRSLRKILDALFGSFGTMIDLAFLLLIFMFVMALLGMSMFGCTEADFGSSRAKWAFQQEGPNAGRLERPNFSTFLYSMTTVFVLITGENWNELMYIAIDRIGWTGAIYFVIVVVTGHYFILNLFLAVLIEQFDKVDTREKKILKETSGSTRYELEPTRSASEYVMGNGLSGSSLFIFSPKNPARRIAWKLVGHPFFEDAIYGLIAVSAVTLAMDSPEVHDPDTKHILKVFDYVTTGCFTLEAFLKIFVYGFILGPHTYMRDTYKILDFFVVVSSVANIVWGELVQTSSGSSREISWVKSLRALRALRPLSLMVRNANLKIVVQSVMRSMPGIMDVMVVLIIFLFIFSILGVQLFKDQFGRHPDWSFDNVAVAGLTLFEVATLETWPDVMWLAVDGGESGYDGSPWSVLFFIVYLFIISFFILNLFVGVVIDKFTEARNETMGLNVFSESQSRWVAAQRLLLRARPRALLSPPDNAWRQLALQLVGSREFEVAILGAIVANTAVMATTSYDASEGVQRIQENANLAFLGIFVGEAALKLYTLRFRPYFRDRWNSFDFLIVGCSVAIAISERLLQAQIIDASLLRLFRIARVFRLVKSLSSLRRLFETLLMSMSSLGTVGMVLFLLFSVYAVSGMALFGDIQIEDNQELRQMSTHVNFRNFYLAMMLLFRLSTGESWNLIMHDCFSGARCAEYPHDTACGNTAVAVAFFVSFMVIGSFVFLNLFIAVIIDKLFESDEQELVDEAGLTICESDIENFVDAWSRISPDGSDFIPTAKLPELLATVDPPLGFCGEAMVKTRIYRILYRLGIRDYGSKVNFTETLWRLASMVMGVDMRKVPHSGVLQNLDAAIVRALPPPRIMLDSSPMNLVYLAAEVTATLKVQSRWRARRTQLSVAGAVSAVQLQSKANSASPIEGAAARKGEAHPEDTMVSSARRPGQASGTKAPQQHPGDDVGRLFDEEEVPSHRDSDSSDVTSSIADPFSCGGCLCEDGVKVELVELADAEGRPRGQDFADDILIPNEALGAGASRGTSLTL